MKLYLEGKTKSGFLQPDFVLKHLCSKAAASLL